MNSIVTAPGVEAITMEEAVMLGAVDSEFFGRFFFPKTCRQESPPFHREVDALLDSNEYPFVSLKMFRGSAKTTKVRLFAAKRVAYAVSRTIMVVGLSQSHAMYTLKWLKKSVEYNARYATAFGLRRGEKWSEEHIEIFHGIDEVPITLLAVGISGNIRGINIEDYRPDLIIVDDPCNEENTATPEQRKKTAELFFGSLAKSLAPASEAPNRKMALLATPLNPEDLVSKTEVDDEWKCLTLGCFDEAGNSRWIARWPTEVLLKEKQAEINRNQLSLWLREMECKLVSPENADFKIEWLTYWDELPPEGRRWIAVDPTPPPSDAEAKKNTTKLDDAVVMVLQMYNGKVYVVDYYTTKSPDEQELVAKIFEMAINLKCRKVVMETTLFQRVLANLFEKEMLRRRIWLTLIKKEDKRHKRVRIRQEVTDRAQSRSLVVNRSQRELIEQYMLYPFVKHDDILDCLAIGLSDVAPWDEDEALEGEFERVDDERDPNWDPDFDPPRVAKDWRTAP